MATFGHYAPFMQGKVVDMFYFPLVEWDMPEWVPVYGGEHCVFFSPVFNFADAAISCGIVALILFYHKILNEYSAKTETTTTEETENTTAS